MADPVDDHVDSPEPNSPPPPVSWVGFYQMVRQLEASSGRRLGTDAMPAEEPIRLTVDLSPNFPAAELAKLCSKTQPPSLAVSFFGLFGASGALPYHYSQLISDRARMKDYALRDFLDLFNHRLLSLFYRSWEKHHFPIAYETARAANLEDRLTQALWALVGNRTRGLANRLSISDDTLLYFAGHFSRARPSADALRAVLRQTFAVDVTIIEFVGQWMLIPSGDQSQAGATSLGETCNNRLGVDAMAGQRTWDIQNRFRICIGPLELRRFLSFTPLGSSLRQLVDCTRRLVGPQYDFDVQVILKREEVAGTRLGSRDHACLGWNTWLGDWTKPVDATDAVFELPDMAR